MLKLQLTVLKGEVKWMGFGAMNEKTLTTLEYFKILEKLAGFCAFAASQEKARNLRPTSDLLEAKKRQTETSEAVRLSNTHPGFSIGGARDLRAQVDLARHNGVLAPNELLDVKSTLTAARTLARAFERLEIEYPVLGDLVHQLPMPAGLIDAITRALSERGEILDSASEKLETIRRDLRIVHDRLLTRLQKMVSDPKNSPYLQEALITQRDGRYVLPLRAEFKGRIRSIIHDQSSSGATLFVEPIAVVDMNNSFRELQLAERDEERRILSELSSLVGAQAEAIEKVIDVLASLDMILARARFSDELRANEPRLHSLSKLRDQEAGPQENSDLEAEEITGPRSISPVIRLYQARHPLLDPESVTPIDFELDPSTFAVVITGPNTGGKTVALKTVGLLALMAQAGLHIPVHSGSELSVFQAIYADIGDEQSIEQSLSTFSGHIRNIIQILDQADPRSLVIMDELGAGTDPQEGSALAKSILNQLVERRITTLVTTHHPELKAFAHATPGVVNASVEFNLDTLRPTYHLTIGLPGRSNALAIAQRLGMPENVIASPRAEIDPSDLRAEDLLDEIHHQRDLARQARKETEDARREAQALRFELLSRLEKIEEERQEVLEKARREAEEQIQTMAAELADARRSLNRSRQPVMALEEIEEKVAELEEKFEAPIEREDPKLGPELRKMEKARRRAIRPGDRVRIRSLGAQGQVTSVGRDEAEVQVGILRMRVPLRDLELPSPSGAVGAEPAPKSRIEVSESSKTRFAYPESPGVELDIRGQRGEDAEEALERYLDSAFLAGLPFVRVIHGKGTGRLREIVRRMMKDHPHVKSFESGGEKEGGDGVTIAKLSHSD